MCVTMRFSVITRMSPHLVDGATTTQFKMGGKISRISPTLVLTQVKVALVHQIQDISTMSVWTQVKEILLNEIQDFSHRRGGVLDTEGEVMNTTRTTHQQWR